MKYRVRYTIELGDFEIPEDAEAILPGISAASGNAGYADEVLVVSFVRQNLQAETWTAVVLSSQGYPAPAPIMRQALAAISAILKTRTRLGEPPGRRGDAP